MVLFFSIPFPCTVIFSTPTPSPLSPPPFPPRLLRHSPTPPISPPSPILLFLLLLLLLVMLFLFLAGNWCCVSLWNGWLFGHDSCPLTHSKQCFYKVLTRLYMKWLDAKGTCPHSSPLQLIGRTSGCGTSLPVGVTRLRGASISRFSIERSNKLLVVGTKRQKLY